MKYSLMASFVIVDIFIMLTLGGLLFWFGRRVAPVIIERLVNVWEML